MNILTDLLLGVGQPRVSHFPDLCTLLYTYLSTLDYWTKIVYYLFTQTSPVAHTSALTPTYIKSQKLPNWPISKELGLGRMLLPHWKLLFNISLGLAGGKYYQWIPMFGVVFQNFVRCNMAFIEPCTIVNPILVTKFCFSGCFPYILCHSLFLLTFFWLGCYCST